MSRHEVNPLESHSDNAIELLGKPFWSPKIDNSTERAKVYALLAIADELSHINHSLELLVDRNDSASR